MAHPSFLASVGPVAWTDVSVSAAAHAFLQTNCDRRFLSPFGFSEEIGEEKTQTLGSLQVLLFLHDAGRFSHALLQVFLPVAERNYVGDGLVDCREGAQDGAEIFSCFLNFLCRLLSDSILAEITRLLSFGQKLPACDAVQRR
jgi:hypothetical protein